MCGSVGSGIYLAMETSTPVGSVAVGTLTEVLAETVLGARSEHAARLIPAIDAVLAAAGCRPRDLSGVVVGRGPGSFTGVRVAAATAKGLVASLGIPLYGCSSLAAAAVQAAAVLTESDPGWSAEGSRSGAAVRRAGRRDSSVHGSPGAGRDAGEAGETPQRVRDLRVLVGGERTVCAVFDARAERVYAACYRVHVDGIEGLVEPLACTMGDVLAAVPVRDVVFAGDGAFRHRERIAGAGWTVLAPPAGVPDAVALLWLLRVTGEGARIANPERWEPDYLRVSNVQVSAGR